jgi:RNase H-fold protein (predicted Holliday junction resolvase)
MIKDLFEALPLIVEAPIIVLLALVVLALGWTLTRVLVSLPGIMREAGEKSREALKQTVDELQENNQYLQATLREERGRVQQAQAEVERLTRRLQSEE